jgi:excisionase family DNA binding protein
MRVDGDTKFLTIAEAAKRARVSERTIRRATAGEVKPLKHLRLGRRLIIAETDLVGWLESHAVTPTISPQHLAGVETLFPELCSHPGVTQTGPGPEKANGHGR